MDSDAWGVPDLLFLEVTAVLGLMATILAAVVRRRLRAGHAPLRELHPYEIAFLIGGGRHVIASALVALHLRGTIEARPDGTLVASELAADGTPLDDAIAAAVRRSGARTVADVASDPRVKAEIEALGAGLTVQGMLVDERRARLMGRAGWPFVAVLAVCLIRFAWYVGGTVLKDAPMPPLMNLLSLPLALVLGLIHALTAVSGHETRAAARELQEVRERHAHLDPRAGPAYTTYGPEAAAMGVAVFGTAALMAIDPMFARSAGLGRLLAMAGSSSSSSGIGYSGFTCSSTASVCSSGSGGGGSSCGGGGGCGGGSGS